MRLIDADKLILHLNDYALQECPSGVESAEDRKISRLVYSAIQNCMKAAEKQPTVFDVDKVVEQIESIKEKEYRACTDEQCGFCDYFNDCWDGEMCDKLALDKAIDIVKRGGVKDEVQKEADNR